MVSPEEKGGILDVSINWFSTYFINSMAKNLGILKEVAKITRTLEIS
jgi:hypothetical protein